MAVLILVLIVAYVCHVGALERTQGAKKVPQEVKYVRFHMIKFAMKLHCSVEPVELVAS